MAAPFLHLGGEDADFKRFSEAFIDVARGVQNHRSGKRRLLRQPILSVQSAHHVYAGQSRCESCST